MSIMYEREAIRRFGGVYTINKNNKNEWLFPCKLCSKINIDNLHVNVKTGKFNCFHGCGNHGRLLQRYQLSDVMQSKEDIQKKKDKQQYLIPFKYKKLSEEQKQALYNRGLDDNDIKFYNIVGDAKSDRIQLPNYVKGCLVDVIQKWEWRKELISKVNPKYLNIEGTKKSNVVYNLHNIPNKVEEIIICEGLFNAITAGKNAVATFGCSPSENQLDLIFEKQPKSITICYDPDQPGVLGTNIIIKYLKTKEFKGKVYFLLLPKGKDANSLGKKIFKKYHDENKNIIDLTSDISCNLPNLLFRSRL